MAEEAEAGKMILIIIEGALLIGCIFMYSKASKAKKEVSQILNESESYAFAKQRIITQKDRESKQAAERAKIIAAMEKEEVKDDGKPV